MYCVNVKVIFIFKITVIKKGHHEVLLKFQKNNGNNNANLNNFEFTIIICIFDTN